VNFERLEDARKVFDETGRRDVVLYNCMVDGYASGRMSELVAANEGRRDKD